MKFYHFTIKYNYFVAQYLKYLFLLNNNNNRKVYVSILNFKTVFLLIKTRGNSTN